jgi:hypothetical protein
MRSPESGCFMVRAMQKDGHYAVPPLRMLASLGDALRSAFAEKRFKPLYAQRQTFGRAGEAPANGALTFGPECAAGRQAQSGFSNQSFAQRERIGFAFNAEKQIHGTRRTWRNNARIAEDRA